MKTTLKIGDSVIVKKGVLEPDFEEFEIGGWQGRVTEIDTEAVPDNILILIEWDSITLEIIPEDYVKVSEIDGMDWESMNLFESALEKTTPRDEPKDVLKTISKLQEKYSEFSIGAKGDRISKILGNANPKKEMECLIKWHDHLEAALTFPINAVVADRHEGGMIKDGDKVVIKSLDTAVDMYGIIISGRFGKQSFFAPLCEMEVVDKKSANFQLIDDYNVWFANR